MLARFLGAALLSVTCLQAGCTVCGVLGDEHCEEYGYEDWKAFRGWWRGSIELAEDHACMSGLSDLFLAGEDAGTLGFHVESGSYPALTYQFQDGDCEFDGEVVNSWATVVNPAESPCVGEGVILTLRACAGCESASYDGWQVGSLVVEGPGGCAGHYDFEAEPRENELW